MSDYALLVGEALMDVVERDGMETAYAGGSVANVAVALARLGRPVRLVTALGADEYGATIRIHLAASGVELTATPTAHTSTARARIEADGSATFRFDIDWRLDSPDLEDAPLVVHIGSISALLAPGGDEVLATVHRCREHATITYDLNARPAVTGTGPDVVARVEQLVTLADVVKASDEDLAAFWPTLTLDQAVAHLRSLGPVVMVTRGEEGAFAETSAGRVTVPRVATDVVDTIGAGDTFAAAAIDGLWRADVLGAKRRDGLRNLKPNAWTAVLTHAARAAAVTVSRPGADPPWAADIS